VVALGGLLLLLDRVGWSNIGRALVGLGIVGALLLAAFGLLETLFDALALRAALRKRHGLVTTLAAHSSGSLVNALVPWDFGEVVKGTMLGPATPPEERVLALVIWNYAFKLTRPVVSLSAALVGATASGIDGRIVIAVLIANLLAFAPYLVLRIAVRTGAAVALVNVLRRIRFVERRAANLLDATERVDARVRAFSSQHPAEYRAILAGQVLARVASFLALYAAITYLGVGLAFATVALVYAGLNVAEYLATILPARIGVGEGICYGLFGLYGLSPATGLMVYLALRIRALAANGLGTALVVVNRQHEVRT
jgi:hypothetical protein